jgi:hypothetical protein
LYVGPHQLHGLKICAHVPEARTGGSVAKKKLSEYTERELRILEQEVRQEIQKVGKRIFALKRILGTITMVRRGRGKKKA